MPITYDLDCESGFIHTRCIGRVALDEVLEHFRELGAEPALPARLDVLLDLGEMETLPESSQLRTVVGAARDLRSRLEWGAWAIVAERDALFGMSRVLEVLAEDDIETARVFRDVREAERWLASVRRSPA